jgi:hypothetical protein
MRCRQESEKEVIDTDRRVMTHTGDEGPGLGFQEGEDVVMWKRPKKTNDTCKELSVMA